MDFGHAFFEVYAIIFYGGDSDVGARGEAIILFGDFCAGGDFAQAENVLVLSVFAKFLYKPDGFLDDENSRNFLFLYASNASFTPRYWWLRARILTVFPSE